MNTTCIFFTKIHQAESTSKIELSIHIVSHDLTECKERNKTLSNPKETEKMTSEPIQFEVSLSSHLAPQCVFSARKEIQISKKKVTMLYKLPSVRKNK